MQILKTFFEINAIFLDFIINLVILEITTQSANNYNSSLVSLLCYLKIVKCTVIFYIVYYKKSLSVGSEDIVTKLVLFTIAVGENTFPEPIVNIVQLYKLILRVPKINIFDGKFKLEISDTYINKK